MLVDDLLLCYKTKLDLVAKGLSICVMVISELTLLWKATEDVVKGSPLTMSHSQSGLFYTFKTHHTILQANRLL